MSVSLKSSVGNCTASLTIDFPASKSSFLARILAIENADTFVSDEIFDSVVLGTSKIVFSGVGIVISFAEIINFSGVV